MAIAIQDTPELEALFEAESAKAALQSKPPADDANLEALFDSIADAKRKALSEAPVVAPPAAEPTDQSKEALYERIGHLTRELHEALRALGLDQSLERAAKGIPETRDRLGYIARLTGQAAERALAAVEVGQAAQAEIQAGAKDLAPRWEKFFARTISLAEFKSLAEDTRLYLALADGKADATNAQLTEIMMAQDFHDLTGQVINKLTGLVQGLEAQLVRFLVDTAPPERRAEIAPELEGPIVNAEGRADVMTSQEQVDDLLESLGF